MIRLVPLAEVDHAWPVVRPWVEQACRKARSNRSAVQLYAQCRNGSLWLAVAITGPALEDIVGVSIMDISESERGRLLQHVIVAGRGDTEVWFEELITWSWIGEMGVKIVNSEGRFGWPERLKKLVPSIRVVRQSFEWTHGDA